MATSVCGRATPVGSGLLASSRRAGQQSRRESAAPLWSTAHQLPKRLVGPAFPVRVDSSRRLTTRRQNSRFIVRAVDAASPPPQQAVDPKDMERVAAKEALLLAIKDAGGVDALSSGKGSDSGRLGVSERVLALERLNPTLRPTTSPLLEGTWEFMWASARSPGLLAARTLIRTLPAQVLSLDSLTLAILDGTATAVASLRLLSGIDTSVSITSKITVEGILKLKEEYVEAHVDTPALEDGKAPSQLKPLLDQLKSAFERLPTIVKDTLAAGVKLPLTNTFHRLLLVSYLDDEMMVVRDTSGVPDVLVRQDIIDPTLSPDLDALSETALEYES